MFALKQVAMTFLCVTSSLTHSICSEMNFMPRMRLKRFFNLHFIRFNIFLHIEEAVMCFIFAAKNMGLGQGGQGGGICPPLAFRAHGKIVD